MVVSSSGRRMASGRGSVGTETRARSQVTRLEPTGGSGKRLLLATGQELSSKFGSAQRGLSPKWYRICAGKSAGPSIRARRQKALSRMCSLRDAFDRDYGDVVFLPEGARGFRNLSGRTAGAQLACSVESVELSFAIASLHYAIRDQRDPVARRELELLFDVVRVSSESERQAGRDGHLPSV